METNLNKLKGLVADSMKKGGALLKDAGEFMGEKAVDVKDMVMDMDEYNIYINAGLYPEMINGKLALIREIDPNYVVKYEDGKAITNLDLMMKEGYSPHDPITGEEYQLHHINQEKNSPLAILTQSEHDSIPHNKT